MEKLTPLELHVAKHGLLGLNDALEVVGHRIYVLNDYYIDVQAPDGKTTQYPNTEEGVSLAWAWAETECKRLNLVQPRSTPLELPPRDYNGEGEGYQWFDGSKGPRCLAHTLTDYYAGSVTRFVAMLKNEDTSFKDVFGNSLDAWHDESMSYETSMDNPFPKGVYCGHDDCDTELMEPDEEEEDDNED